MNKRYLVISGGGSKGSYAAGLVNKLYDMGTRWNGYYGTSTGSLLNTLISVERFADLKEVYTNVTNSDIFDVNPFTKKGKIRILNLIWRLILGKTSIGSAKKLYKLICKTFTNDDYNKTVSKNIKVCSCATNYTNGSVAYISNLDHEYDDFTKGVFASASVPLAMDLVKINGIEYLDGGVMEHIPIQKAIDDGADIIDVIILRPNYSELVESWKSKNIPNVATRTIDLMMREISNSDLIIGGLKSDGERLIKINFYYTPESLTGNSLIFDKEKMLEWWNMGYNLIGDFQILKTKKGERTGYVKTYTI